MDCVTSWEANNCSANIHFNANGPQNGLFPSGFLTGLLSRSQNNYIQLKYINVNVST
jgi:hypothetical protein